MSVARLNQEVNSLELTYWQEFYVLEKEDFERRTKKTAEHNDTAED